MSIALLLLCLSDKTLAVQYTDVAPVLDGRIEDVWLAADSVSDFVQYMPTEGAMPSERTVVRVLQDRSNLYVCFSCYYDSLAMIQTLGAGSDNVMVYLDPFGSMTTAYYFKVGASGWFQDGLMLDDGRNTDDSWDGVWSRATRVYDRRYVVEICIPFKSIRYKKGLTEWGVNFRRYFAVNLERDFWAPYTQKEGVLVSQCGTLTQMNPQATGYYFELYPEGLLRAQTDPAASDDLGSIEIEGDASLNAKWDITPQVTLNGTLHPDFAQIESDPYSLNLTRYETYLSERRPFFLEGADIFRLSDFGEGRGFFTPLKIFYSRRIGKATYTDVVPIDWGLKLTGKSADWNVAAFGAATASLHEPSTQDTLEFPRTFGVARVKRSFGGMREFGLLASGSLSEADDNYAIAADAVLRSGFDQFILQAAGSDRNGKQGWALSSGFFGDIGKFMTLAGADVISDSFDVDIVGYVPWAGRKRLAAFSGPFKVYPQGALQSLWIAPGIQILQEPGDTENWSTVGMFNFNPNWRNNFGFNVELGVGPYYEADTSYIARTANAAFWYNNSKTELYCGGTAQYSYNWYRGYLANQAYLYLTLCYDIFPRVGIVFDPSAWIEWDPDRNVAAITPYITPRLDLTLTPYLSVSIFNEMVFAVPETNFNSMTHESNRFSTLVSWNFRPKSWIYLALNDYRLREVDQGLEPVQLIGMVKAKILLYF